MLPWVLLFLAIAIVGLALIGLVCWRLFGKIRMLSREMATAAERFAELQEALDSVLAHSADQPPVADVAVSRTGNGQVYRARSFESGSRADRH